MQNTAYDVRISDWSSDVCSADLRAALGIGGAVIKPRDSRVGNGARAHRAGLQRHPQFAAFEPFVAEHAARGANRLDFGVAGGIVARSEEHTSELQSLMRISYAVFCLKKKKT